MVWIRNFQGTVVFCESLLKLHSEFLVHLLGGGKYDVNVVCMDGKAIQTLNRRYRGVDKPTDVLSFPYHERLQPGELPLCTQQWDWNLGDIILGMSVIEEACRADCAELKDRLPVIVTHSLCHLIGYHHDDQQNLKLMYNKEKSMLDIFNRNFGTTLVPLINSINGQARY